MANVVEYLLRARDMLSPVFARAGQQASTVEQRIRRINTTQQHSVGTIGRLTNAMRYLQERRDRAFDESHIARYNQSIRNIQQELQRLGNLPPRSFIQRMRDANSSAGTLMSTLTRLVAVIGIAQVIRSGEEAFKAQAVAEAQLTAVMRNTMNARRDDVQSILALTAAQQKLGIVAAEVQISGSQELSTYLTKTSTLKRIIPVMNDMLAQQYGLNATQEQAVNIASMLGKVMDGQVGALSRYGYKFDEAQEKMLKYGSEAERVAVLVDVVSSAVGGVNAALAATPEGKLKQQEQDLGGIQQRIGGLMIQAKTMFAPALSSIINMLEKMISFIERNAEVLFQLVSVVVGAVTAFYIITGAIQAWIMITKVWTIVTSAQTIAQGLLNLAMKANPIGLVIAGIAALVAAIVYCYNKFDWFRGIIGGVWESFKALVSFIKDGVMVYINGLMDMFSGLGTIIKAIFSADWDGIKEGANQVVSGYKNTITEMVDVAKNNAPKIAGAFKDGYEKGLNSGGIDADGFFGGLGSSAVTDTAGSFAPSGSTPDETIKSIAGGGAKATHINVNVNKEMVGSITINPVTMSQGVEEVKELMMQALAQVLNSANKMALE